MASEGGVGTGGASIGPTKLGSFGAPLTPPIFLETGLTLVGAAVAAGNLSGTGPVVDALLPVALGKAEVRACKGEALLFVSAAPVVVEELFAGLCCAFAAPINAQKDPPKTIISAALSDINLN